MLARVHLRTVAEADRSVIAELEGQALDRACCSFVLSRSDSAYIREHYYAAQLSQAAPLHVLLPALRHDMGRLPPPGDVAAPSAGGGAGSAVTDRMQPPHTLAARASSFSALTADAVPVAESMGGTGREIERSRARKYLTCCVRLSPEKEPHRFVHALCTLQARGTLERLGITPFMCGAGWESEYGAELRARLQRDVPGCIIMESFMGAHELAAVYRETVLNVHPPLYDAYVSGSVENKVWCSAVRCDCHGGYMCFWVWCSMGCLHFCTHAGGISALRCMCNGEDSPTAGCMHSHACRV